MQVKLNGATVAAMFCLVLGVFMLGYGVGGFMTDGEFEPPVIAGASMLFVVFVIIIRGQITKDG